MQRNKLDERSRVKTLNDVAPKTVLEVLSWTTVSTVNGDAILLEITETRENREVTWQLMIPDRFRPQCETKVPCVIYYDGKKPMKGGKEAHDLRFFETDDKDIFHDSDDEADDDEGLIDDLECRTCDDCAKEKRVCEGFCIFCNNHQPRNGSQCRCTIYAPWNKKSKSFA